MKKIIKKIEGIFTKKDEIAPAYINTKNPKNIEIDGTYYSGIIIVNYNRENTELILRKIIDTNINMNISCFYEKQDAYKTIRNLSYHIANVGVDLKDDKNNLIYSFYQDKLNIDDYTPSKIDSIISKIYTDSSMINLYDVNTKLTNSLIEYKNYLKYINLIKKIKTLYKEEIEKDFLNKRLKQIAKLEAKLFKLTKKSSKRLSFAKVDKYTPEIDATIKEISDIYKEIDDNILKVKIKNN